MTLDRLPLSRGSPDATSEPRAGARRRAVILPVVMFMLLILGVFVATFAFRINADVASMRAVEYRVQTRLAAEAGVDKVKMMLAVDHIDMGVWHHNPDELHRIILWSDGGDQSIWGSNEELDEGTMAYRFSIVADNAADDEEFARYGVTDESSKLNLNLATEAQLLILVSFVVADDQEINPQEIVDAILDWRDPDSDPRGDEGDTEGDYYRDLPKPYPVKNAPFDSVEELLLVKGVTGQVLYGEDYDRNGLLTDNEDDGNESFPPDDQDGELNRGLFPFLTVLSYESNTNNGNRPRVYLLGEQALVREQLEAVFPDDPDLVEAIAAAAAAASPPANTGTEDANAGGGMPVGDGAGEAALGGAASGGRRGAGRGDGGASTGRRGGRGRGGGASGGGDARPGDRPRGGSGGANNKSAVRSQVRDDGKDEQPLPGDFGSLPPGDAPVDDGDGGFGDAEPDETQDDSAGDAGAGETDNAGSGASPMRSPAELLRAGGGGLGVEHLAVLMDQTTTIPPQQQRIEGLININTAPPLVLRCIEGLTEEQVLAIVATRADVEPEDKATTAWLVTQEVLDLDTYIDVAPQITARGQQFTIESLGYADHVGMVTRLQVVVDMLGPVPQTIYYRDLSSLGGNFPIRDEYQEHGRVE